MLRLTRLMPCSSSHLDRAAVEKFGLAQCVMPDADVAEGNRAAYARADGFGKGFFGGKAFGKVVDGFARLRKFKQLFRSEDTHGKRLSEFFV